MATVHSPQPPRAETPPQELFPIRTVARMTGVNPVTLRAWERRYGLMAPHRTPSGHRMYSRTQVAQVRRVLGLLEQGMSICQAAALVEREAAGESPPGTPRDAWETYRQRALGAIRCFDEAALDTVFTEVLALFPVDAVTRRLVLPVLCQLGDSWATRDAGIAEEHFFTMHLRGRLAARRRGRGAEGTGPMLVAACLPGERHELGLMLFCLAAQMRGYRVVLLGADTPVEDLPSVATRTAASAVLLSGSLDPGPRFFGRDLPALVATLDVPVFLGGAVSVEAADRVSEGGAVPLGDAIEPGLERLVREIKL